MKKLLLASCMFMFLGTAIVKAQASSMSPTTKVMLDNSKVKVTEYDSAAGKDVCGVGKHSHPAHLTILLTEATVTITTADGKVIIQKVPAGTAFWSEAETHTVVNSGDMPVKAYLIETKQ